MSPLTARRIGARPGSLPGVSRAHSTEPIPVSFFIFFCCTAVLCEPCALSKEAEISSVLTFQSSRRKGQKPVTREKMLHHLSFELASSPSPLNASAPPYRDVAPTPIPIHMRSYLKARKVEANSAEDGAVQEILSKTWVPGAQKQFRTRLHFAHILHTSITPTCITPFPITIHTSPYLVLKNVSLEIYPAPYLDLNNRCVKCAHCDDLS